MLKFGFILSILAHYNKVGCVFLLFKLYVLIVFCGD